MIMKKIYSLIASAIVVAGFTACTQNDFIEGTPEGLSTAVNDNSIQFGTYLGKTGTTRAGKTGNITNTELKTTSFGVFGYYTSGSSGYDYWNTCAANGTKGTNNATNATAANFMYNQKITWITAENTGYVAGDNTGYWSYTPIKYWPNDFSNADVDDQDDDANTDPAKGSSDENYSNSRLSFFAYAPYVEFSNAATSGLTGTSPVTAGTYGITAINGATDAAGDGSSTGNKAAQDPILTYVLNQTHAVDLLWGTAGSTSVNVNNETQDADRTSNSHTGWSLTGSTYGNVSQYPVNINLTKQKTTGVVDFNFKHALSKVGGSTTTQPAGTVTPNGLMVVLDIDDMKGAETGGTKDATTLVTIKSISIKVGQVGIDENNNRTIDSGEKKYVTGGTFNLATGQWTVTASESGSDVTNNITSPAESSLTSSATLADAIAEPETSAKPSYDTEGTKWKTGSTELPGVTTNPVNVYKEETNPFVFIPGTYPIMDITVDYIVRTYDANLSTTFSEVEQVITKHVEFAEPVQLNKQYNLLMHLGLTSVKFTATVSDWDVDGNDSDDDDVIEDNEITIKDVYLPRNVASYTLSYSSLTEAANSVSATATFTATATCSDTETAQAVTYEATSSNTDVATVSINSSTGAATVTFTAANNTVDKKYVDITVTAKVGENVVATEDVGVYQSACDLTITNPTITAGNTSVNLVITSPNTDLTSNTITVTATKGGSAFTDFTVGTATFADNKTTIPITLGTAAANNETYQFTVTVNDAQGTASATVN